MRPLRTPPLLARARRDVIPSVLGKRVNWPASELAVPGAQTRMCIDAPAGVAVIPIHGTRVRRARRLDAASGLTSCGEIGAMLDAALTDPAVTGILLDLDSPGGEAGGVCELAERSRAADAVNRSGH